MYDPCTARWLSQDPLAEKYCSVSPYAFCNNNPVNIIDPNGMDIAVFNTSGYLISYKERKGKDILKIVSIDEESGKKKLIAKQSFEDNSISKPEEDGKNTIFNSSENSTEVFEFLSNNTDVEWSKVEYSDGSPTQIGNSHGVDKNSSLIKSIKSNESNVTKAIHSHPSEPYASPADKNVIRMFKNKKITFAIFHKLTNKYIKYNQYKTLYEENDYNPFGD